MHKKGYITDIIVPQDEFSKLEGLVDFYYISNVNGKLKSSRATVQIPHTISLLIPSKYSSAELFSRFAEYKKDKFREFEHIIEKIETKEEYDRKLTKKDEEKIKLIENYIDQIDARCSIKILPNSNDYNRVLLTSFNHGKVNVVNYFNNCIRIGRISSKKPNEYLSFSKIVELRYGYGLKSYPFMIENSKISMQDLLEAKACSLDIETKGWKRKYFADVHGSLSREQKIEQIKQSDHFIRNIDLDVYSDGQLNNILDGLVSEADMEHMTSVGILFFPEVKSVIPTAFPNFSTSSLTKDPITGKIIESSNFAMQNDIEIVGFVNKELINEDPIIMETQNGIGFDYAKMNDLSKKQFMAGENGARLNINYVNKKLPTNSLKIPGRIDIDSHQILRVFSYLPDTKLDTLFTYFTGIVEKKAFATHAELEKDSIEAYENANKKVADEILKYNLDDLLKAHYPCKSLRDEAFDYEKLFELPLTRIFGSRFKRSIEHFWLKKFIEQQKYLNTSGYMRSKIITDNKSEKIIERDLENKKTKKLNRNIEIFDVLGSSQDLIFDDFNHTEFNSKLFNLLANEVFDDYKKHIDSKIGIQTGYRIFPTLSTKQFEKIILEDHRLSKFFAKIYKTQDKDKKFRRSFILESILSYPLFGLMGQRINRNEEAVYDMDYSLLYNMRISAANMEKHKVNAFNNYRDNFKNIIAVLGNGIVNYAKNFIYVNHDKKEDIEKLEKLGVITTSEPGIIFSNKKGSLIFREYNKEADTSNRITFYGFPNYKNNKGKKNKFIRNAIQPLLEDIVLGEGSKSYLEKLNLMNKNLFSFYYDKRSLSKEKQRELEDNLVEVIEAAFDFYDASLDSNSLGTIKVIEKRASQGDALEIMYNYRDMMRFLYGLSIDSKFETSFEKNKSLEYWDLDEIYNYEDLKSKKGINFHNGYVSRFFNSITNVKKINEDNQETAQFLIRLFQGLASNEDINEYSQIFDELIKTQETQLAELI